MDKGGRPMMVDVSDKPVTQRTAQAEGKVMMSQAAFDLAYNNPKGCLLYTSDAADE